MNHKWTALVEAHRGFAVLNDCKYGVNVLGNTIGLTVLKSALAPDMRADKGTQVFTYALYAWNGSLFDSGLVQQGYDLNCSLMAIPGDAGEHSMFAVDAPNVIVETVKPAEDGGGDVIVRLYESQRTATRCRLGTSLPLTRAAETNMLEADSLPLAIEGDQVSLDFRPFEIKTVRIALGQ